MKIKRLLCILNNMNVGGAETFLMKVLRQIDKTKYILDFCLCSEGESFYEKEIISLGGKIFHIPPKKKGYRLFKNNIKKIVLEENYSTVLRISDNAIVMSDFRFLKRNGVQSCAIRSSNSSSGGNIFVKLANIFGKLLFLKYADIKIAPSTECGIHLFGRKSDFKIVHNAIKYDSFCFDDQLRVKIRNLIGARDDTIVFGHVGRFDNQKNHSFLIKTFYEYHKINNNCLLLLVGEGALMSNCKELVKSFKIEKKVIFVGRQLELKGYLSAMDIFLFPSLFEGMPNTLIEAQANGLPCLVSDTVTKESNITNHVVFLPIKKPSVWVGAIITATNKMTRYNSFLNFQQSGYLIEDVANKFIETLFDCK